MKFEEETFYNVTGYDALPLVGIMTFEKRALLSKCCSNLNQDAKLQPTDYKQIEDYLCS